MDGKKVVNINSKEDFNAFYKACVHMRFDSKLPVSELLRERLLRGDEGMFCVTATHNLTKELYLAAIQAIASGNHICILLISDDVSEETKKIIDGMKASGIELYQIMSEDELVDILSLEIV